MLKALANIKSLKSRWAQSVLFYIIEVLIIFMLVYAKYYVAFNKH